MPEITLPVKFAHLEVLVEEWSISTEEARYLKRHNSTLEEQTYLYNAVNPYLDEIAAYLDQYSIKELSPECSRLLNLALMCQECFSSVELFKHPHVPKVLPWQRFKVSSSIIDEVRKKPVQRIK